MAEELMLKVDNVYKKYRLGLIGGGTLRGDLQSWWAKVRGKDDPNGKLGDKYYDKNETFYALNGISFEVHKGEAIGLIGGNGAGKSTTLKLLSQVTAPSSGKIYLNGRVASMLEVGTGFHPELTGRENIYLNGAILGMTKAEIDRKIEEIIDFSECRQFIDTPVKRYSSGMYVKLAFSVAAHLDSEIMIMDEVLAVGDMTFQEKCLDKMNDISKKEGRTILYVSHNMNTIKQLCKRCIVLEHGRVIFDGDCDEAIELYLGKETEFGVTRDVDDYERTLEHTGNVHITRIDMPGKTFPVINEKEQLRLEIYWTANNDIKQACFRLPIHYRDGSSAGMFISENIHDIKKNTKYKTTIVLNTVGLVKGKYNIGMIVSEINNYGGHVRADHIYPAMNFTVETLPNSVNNIQWNHNVWGHYTYPNTSIITEMVK